MIITILRKPLEGTVAENTLKHGCGALNIDATRVSTTEEGNKDRATSGRRKRKIHLGFEGKAFSFPKRINNKEYPDTLGRWPANFILIHKKGCELKGVKEIKGNRSDTRPDDDEGRKDTSEWRFRPTSETKRGYSNEDGNEEVADWDCEEGCPVKNLDYQSGVLKSGAMDSIAKGGQYTTFGKMYERRVQNPASEGGASRFFKQFKKENDQ
jgi:hypothetical protein